MTQRIPLALGANRVTVRPNDNRGSTRAEVTITQHEPNPAGRGGCRDHLLLG